VFGVITGYLASTHPAFRTSKDFLGNQAFRSYSAPFVIPVALAKPEWQDLGEQTYFTITVDMARVLLDGGNVSNRNIIQKPEYAQFIKTGGWAERLLVPVTITNNSNNEYIPAIGTVRFYVVQSGSQRQKPSPWETMKALDPILAPGKSIQTDRSYITLDELEHNYKAGDRIVASVGGKVPNTNQIFECYSAPFELPPLPPSQPPGPAKDLDDLIKKDRGIPAPSPSPNP